MQSAARIPGDPWLGIAVGAFSAPLLMSAAGLGAGWSLEAPANFATQLAATVGLMHLASVLHRFLWRRLSTEPSAD